MYLMVCLFVCSPPHCDERQILGFSPVREISPGESRGRGQGQTSVVLNTIVDLEMPMTSVVRTGDLEQPGLVPVLKVIRCS